MYVNVACNVVVSVLLGFICSVTKGNRLTLIGGGMWYYLWLINV